MFRYALRALPPICRYAATWACGGAGMGRRVAAWEYSLWRAARSRRCHRLRMSPPKSSRIAALERGHVTPRRARPWNALRALSPTCRYASTRRGGCRIAASERGRERVFSGAATRHIIIYGIRDLWHRRLRAPCHRLCSHMRYAHAAGMPLCGTAGAMDCGLWGWFNGGGRFLY